MRNKRLFIYCAGGQGRETLKVVRTINQREARWEDVFFVDDYSRSSVMNDIPVITFSDYLRDFAMNEDRFIIANGEPVRRQQIAEVLLQHSCQLETLVYPGIDKSPFHMISEGVFIAEGVVLSDNISVGYCTCLNANATIGHNVELGDYVTISPGAIISGDVTIGAGTYIGTGAIIRDEVKIGKNCIIGMGSLVTKDIPDNVVAYGSPCHVVRENTDGIVFR